MFDGLVEVTAFATHGLSCVQSHGRHSSLNDIISSGISRSDGKRPDGATLVPWKCGKLIVWDATCMDTNASSYSRVASQEAGAVADQADRTKSEKYSKMDPNMHLFAPVIIETSGVFGKQALSFLLKGSC